MRILIIIACCFSLMGMTCRKNYCNTLNVDFINKSSDTIIYAYKYTKNGQCYLDGWKLAPDSQYRSNSTIDCDAYSSTENDDQKIIEIFIADPSTFVNHTLVPCETLLQSYPILKHYDLSKKELKAIDYTIKYE